MKSIILLHGAIGAKDQLEPLSLALEQQGLTTYSMSFSGHGRQPFNSEFSISAFANELHSFITEHQLLKPMIFGYSMGGYVALYLALKQPDLIGHIITLGTKFQWTPEIAEKETAMLNPETIIAKVPKFAEALKERHGNGWEILLAKTAEMMRELGNTNILTPEISSGIENKVMLGLADKDTMVSLDETTAIYRQLKNGSMYMLPHTKHPIETINVNLLAELIAGFN